MRIGIKSVRGLPWRIKLVLALVVMSVLWMPYSMLVDIRYTTNYSPILDVIAQGESRGNYNAYFGNAGNMSIEFTGMTVAQVLQWQQAFLAHGQPSSAVGKYQFLRPTLLGLVQQLKIDPETTIFDEHTQDQLAVALLQRRGAQAYLGGTLSETQFASNLSMEWASLPKASGPRPQQSYYAGDSLNKSQVPLAEVYQALATMKADRTQL
jgi:conjugal transfer mating pair stabilization protein TraG